MGDGGYTLNAWSSGKPENSLFAVVIVRSESPIQKLLSNTSML